MPKLDVNNTCLCGIQSVNPVIMLSDAASVLKTETHLPLGNPMHYQEHLKDPNYPNHYLDRNYLN